MQVHYQLATLKKGGSSVTEYFQKFKSMADTFAAAGQPLNDFELVSLLLVSLGSEFDPYVTSVTSRVDPMTIEELYAHLLNMKCAWKTTPRLLKLFFHQPVLPLPGHLLQNTRALPVQHQLKEVPTIIIDLRQTVAAFLEVEALNPLIHPTGFPHAVSAKSVTNLDTQPFSAIIGLIILSNMRTPLTCRPSTPLLAHPPVTTTGTRTLELQIMSLPS
jgi:hypothetical protein